MRWWLMALLACGCTTHSAQPPAQPPARAAYQPSVQCPQQTRWDGHACIYQYVLTDVRCPAGSAWNGAVCMATKVVCPAGARWIEGACVADVVDSDGEIINSIPADVATVSEKEEIFKEREGPKEDEPRNPQLPSPYDSR